MLMGLIMIDIKLISLILIDPIDIDFAAGENKVWARWAKIGLEGKNFDA